MIFDFKIIQNILTLNKNINLHPSIILLPNTFHSILNIKIIHSRSGTHKSTLLPMPLVYFTRLVYQLTIALPLSVHPLSDVIITIGVNKPTVAIIRIILEHTFVNDVVNFFSHTIYFSIRSQLTYNVSIVFTLPKLHRLVDKLSGISHDVFKSKRAKFIPFFFCCSQGNSMGIFIVNFISFVIALVWEVSWCK